MTRSCRSARTSHGFMLFALMAGTSCANLPPPEPIGVPKQFQDRQLVLTLVDDRAEQRAAITQSLVDDYGLVPKGQFPLQSINVQCIVLQVPSAWSITEELERLARDRRVESVQVNQMFDSRTETHTDPYGKMQYGARVLGATAVHRWATGRGIKIAVIDTGIDINHPDLRQRIVGRENFVDGGEATFTMDRHGTAVAGVIGATADDGKGIFGVAPEAELLAAKACWQDPDNPSRASCSSWTLAKAIDYAITHNARIINMSLAGPYDPLLARLIAEANARGITVVAAVADPQAADAGFPASLPAVIAITSSNAKNQVKLPLWHREGLLAAPGEEILTTTPADTYDFMTGSSLAAAQVSGTIALLLQLEPALTPAQTAERLRNTARPVSPAGERSELLPGVVNICAALNQQLPGTPCE